MKYCFIINPASGKQGTKEGLDARIKEICRARNADVSIFFTEKRLDAREYIASYPHEDTSEEIRVYACGGDGTLGECVNGLMSRESRENMSLGVIPVGTGNDFVRNFGGSEHFMDIEAQLDAEPVDIDLMCCNGFYSVNMINVGFDCQVVVKTAQTKKYFPSKLAYIAGLVITLIKKPGTRARIEADGETLEIDGKLLLMTFANGSFCGGGFQSNPNARLEDGKINALIVRDISRTKFVSIVGSYKSGTHLTEKNAAIIYERNASAIDVTFDEVTDISVDGEIVRADALRLECVPSAISLLVPKGAEYVHKNICEGETVTI